MLHWLHVAGLVSVVAWTVASSAADVSADKGSPAESSGTDFP